MNMFQSLRFDNYENFIDQCDNCSNPYSIEFVLPQLLVPNNLSPAQNKPSPMELQPIANPTTNPITNPTNNPINNPTNNQMDVCQALQSSGFDPNWTYNDVQNLLKTDDGKLRIQKINDDTKNKTGLREINNQNIANCYPKFVNNYVCTNDQNTCNSDLIKAKALIDSQTQMINDLKKNLNTLSESKNTVPTNLTDIRLQNNIMNELAIANNESKQPVVEIKNPSGCNLSDIENEIKSNVEQFYDSSFNEIKRNLAEADIEKTRTQFLNLAKIISNKAILEFEQLINIYQNQNIANWQRDLTTRKIYSVRGHPVPGTDFYIPWSIFDKYQTCFGLGST